MAFIKRLSELRIKRTKRPGPVFAGPNPKTQL
jgi:hypothetical protein